MDASPERRSEATEVKLNLGCGPNVFPGWVNIDREFPREYLEYLTTHGPDARMPETQRKLSEYLHAGGYIDFRVHDLRRGLTYATDTVDLIYLGQVVEHLNPVYEALALMKECRRVLKPGGILRIATPDLGILLLAYASDDMDRFASEQPDYYKKGSKGAKLSYIMFGSTGPISTWDHYEGHMMIYDAASMDALLVGAGFELGHIHYTVAGQSLSDVIEREVVDTGVSHSMFVEAVK